MPHDIAAVIDSASLAFKTLTSQGCRRTFAKLIYISPWPTQMSLRCSLSPSSSHAILARLPLTLFPPNLLVPLPPPPLPVSEWLSGRLAERATVKGAGGRAGLRGRLDGFRVLSGLMAVRELDS